MDRRVAWVILNAINMLATGGIAALWYYRGRGATDALRAEAGGTALHRQLRRNRRYSIGQTFINAELMALGAALVAVALGWHDDVPWFVVGGTAGFAGIWLQWAALALWDWYEMGEVARIRDHERFAKSGIYYVTRIGGNQTATEGSPMQGQFNPLTNQYESNGKLGGVIAPVLARTATFTGDAIDNPGYVGLRVDVSISAVTSTPSVTFSIERWNEAQQAWVNVLTSAAKTGTGNFTLKVTPAILAAANVTAQEEAPGRFRVKTAVGNANSMTYAISYEWLAANFFGA